MKQTIGILGCGWLGLPLAKKLISAGHTIHGSTTSADKVGQFQEEGIRPFVISLNEDAITGDISRFLRDVDTVVVSVPPGLRGKNKSGDYVQKMRLLQQALSRAGVKNVLFVSSTSVYGNLAGAVNEESETIPVTESGKQVLEAEWIFRNTENFSSTIIRFGGLIGPGRHPVTHLSGRKGLKNGREPINLIHLDDCIEMIRTILDNSYWGETFNGVYPWHPGKQEYYVSEARKKGLPLPEYESQNTKIRGKFIKSRNFINKNYRFLTTISDEFTTEK